MSVVNTLFARMAMLKRPLKGRCTYWIPIFNFFHLMCYLTVGIASRKQCLEYRFAVAVISILAQIARQKHPNAILLINTS